eukprot:gene5423-9236_t
MKRTISMQINQLSKEGWLQKRGQIKKTWKKRYFILKNDLLFYFQDNKDSLHPLGIIYLKNATIEKDPKDSVKHSFVVHSDKSYFLQASSSEEKYFWISSLEFRISNLSSLGVDQKVKELTETTEDLQNEKLKYEKIEKSINEIVKPSDQLIFLLSKFIQMMKIFISNGNEHDIEVQKKINSSNILEAFNKRVIINSQKCQELNNLLINQDKFLKKDEEYLNRELNLILKKIKELKNEMIEIKYNWIEMMDLIVKSISDLKMECSNLISKEEKSTIESDLLNELSKIDQLENDLKNYNTKKNND